MTALPLQMAAVLLTGHGGFDKLEYREDVPVPAPGPEEVLIKVAAAAINNTDINTRIGWYSKAVRGGIETGGGAGFAEASRDDSGWTGGPFRFPRIQGADCCGKIVAVGEGVAASRLGERVIVRNMLRSPVKYRPFECWTFGSECDGAFAQYATAPANETYRIDCPWSDVELAAIPCAYSTAENMLQRAGVRSGERVVVTGASGGVGSAAVQLAKRRGAEVIALAATDKADAVRALGADHVLSRDAGAWSSLKAGTVDTVIDVAGGPDVSRRLEYLKRGGRYALAGAIAGAMAEIDLRVVYLRDLTLLGCTFQEDGVFEHLVSYIERDEIRPVVARTYPLKEIAAAQRDFLEKRFVGKLVLIPPQR